MTGLRGQRNGPRSAECLRESRQHCQISVERDTLQPTNAKRREAVDVLQVAERPLDSRSAPVEVTEALRVARDTREQATAESERQGWLVRLRTTERDNRVAVPRFASAYTRELS
jgi:hypothetical protein